MKYRHIFENAVIETDTLEDYYKARKQLELDGAKKFASRCKELLPTVACVFDYILKEMG